MSPASRRNEDLISLVPSPPITKHALTWVQPFEDFLDRRLAGQWRLQLGNMSTEYIRIFPLPDHTFLLDNTKTEEMNVRCKDAGSVEHQADAWLKYHKERHRL